MNDNSPKKALFSVSHLQKSYPEPRVKIGEGRKSGKGSLDPVLNIEELTLYSGKFIAIMGVSGSGKSTLLNLLGRLDHPDREDNSTIQYIHEDGKRIPYSQIGKSYQTDHEFRKRHFGYVFQRCYELKPFKAVDNIAFPLAVRGVESKERRSIALEMGIDLGLNQDSLLKPAGSLSGGQISRVSMLRGIAHDPDVVFADEPTSNLDLKTGLMVMELLEWWKEADPAEKAKRTVVMVTHNLEHALTYADQIVVLKEGACVFNQVRPEQRNREEKKTGWETHVEQIRAHMQVESPQLGKTKKRSIESKNPFQFWIQRQKFAWEFAWKDLFPNLNLKGLTPVFLSVLSLWFLLLIGFLFSDLKQVGALNNRLLLMNPFLLKIDVSERGTEGFSPRAVDLINSVGKQQLLEFTRKRIQSDEKTLQRLEAEKKESQVKALADELNEKRLFLQLLEKTKDHPNIAMVYPFGYTSAHFKDIRGIDAPGRDDGRTLKNWKDHMISKLTYLTDKPDFKTFQEPGIIATEQLVVKLGYRLENATHLTYKYAKPNKTVNIPVLAVVRQLPGEAQYLISKALQEKLLGECYQETQHYRSVRLGPIEGDQVPLDWQQFANNENVELFAEQVGDQYWIRWKMFDANLSLPIANWRIFLNRFTDDDILLKEIEKYTPPCDDIALFFPHGSVYAMEQGYVPALSLLLEEGLEDLKVTVLDSEKDAIKMANRSASFVTNLFFIIIVAVIVLGLSVIFSTFSASIERKSAEIAVIQALGANSRKIAQIFSIETLIVIGIASVLGLLLDSFIMDWILNSPAFKSLMFPKNIDPQTIQELIADLDFWPGRSLIILYGSLLALATIILTVFLFLRRPIAEAVREN